MRQQWCQAAARRRATFSTTSPRTFLRRSTASFVWPKVGPPIRARGGRCPGSVRWGRCRRKARCRIALTVLALATLTDLRTRRIPNRLIVLGAIAVVVAALSTGTFRWALIGAVVTAAPLLAIYLVSPRLLRGGDVKLAAVTGAGLGVVSPALGVIALTVAVMALLAVSSVRRVSSLPMAPGFAIGALVALFLSGRGWI